MQPDPDAVERRIRPGGRRAGGSAATSTLRARRRPPPEEEPGEEMGLMDDVSEASHRNSTAEASRTSAAWGL